MEALTVLAARYHQDYQQSRLAAFRGEFTAELRKNRWQADARSFQEWVERRRAPMPVPAA